MRVKRMIGLMAAAALMVPLTLPAAGAALPPGGTFIDDDGNPHEGAIEAIAAAEITTGCNPPIGDQYCPTQTVTRAEMAAFLLRAIGQAGELPAYQGTFTDVPSGQWYTGYVERLAQLGIAEGYADGTYQPSGQVTRAEMAIFVVRALGEEANLGTYRGLFGDVAASAGYATHAERMFDLGITTGCATGPLRYCPTQAVTRAQMASFLARAMVSPRCRHHHGRTPPR